MTYTDKIKSLEIQYRTKSATDVNRVDLTKDIIEESIKEDLNLKAYQYAIAFHYEIIACQKVSPDNIKYLMEVANRLQNPNLMMIATAATQDTLNSVERCRAIDYLYLNNLIELTCDWNPVQFFIQSLFAYIQPESTADLFTETGFSTLSIANSFDTDNSRIYAHLDTQDQSVIDKFTQRRDAINQTKRVKIENNILVPRVSSFDMIHADCKGYEEDFAITLDNFMAFLKEEGTLILYRTNESRFRTVYPCNDAVVKYTDSFKYIFDIKIGEGLSILTNHEKVKFFVEDYKNKRNV
jgi:predicted O-methyltransferase YrrM|tara:strand:- start:879 stop:1766 length:888 start_codon:yes stop_codon:yes gene_type:complete